ncbi:MAG TPA: thiamine phosphate synthase [Chitinophagales bacterium]|nr:thiamine phosphate synthase [Chitinophagales bacterium]
MSGNSHNGEFKLIVISSPEGFEHEIYDVQAMFKAGMQHFHLRKPKFSTNTLRHYIERIDKKYHNRIVLHSHHELCIPFRLRGIHLTRRHLKKNYIKNWLQMKYIKMRRPKIEITAGYHTITSFKIENPGYSYVFLSPIFDSISKVGYKSTFSQDSLEQMLHKTSYNVIALGGVDEDKIEQAKKWGFSGVAVLGSLWKSKDPVEKFKRIQSLCEQISNK